MTAQVALARGSIGAKGLAATVVRMLLIALLINLGMYVAGTIDGPTTWQTTVLFSPIAIILGWVYWALKQGTVELTATHLIVRKRMSKDRYKWQDVLTIRIVSSAEDRTLGGIMWRILGFNLSEPRVELQLRRSRRIAVFTRSETDVLGLAARVKTANLYVADPEGLVRAAKRYVWDARASAAEPCPPISAPSH